MTNTTAAKCFKTLVALFLVLLSGTIYATIKKAQPPAGAKAFTNPKAAADALVAAAAADDVSVLSQILGPDGQDLINTPDPVADKESHARFAAEARKAMAFDTSVPNRAVLLVGSGQWPLPIPIVKRGDNWYFDAKVGRDEIVYRRIGANELDVIQICRGYVEAQRQYAAEIHDDSGVNQYAQRLISTPGKQDGLYWQNADKTPGGPIGEVVARAIGEGYSVEKPSPYHGYYFKILKGQGPAAPLGRVDYVLGGLMIGGFAMAAVPAEYWVTGVQTFVVSNDGIVYQKDLGPNSRETVKEMEVYNPDKSWHPVEDGK